MCGGTLGGTGRNPTGLGLSPRVRGNRRQRYDGRTQRGSIPACAGEPELARVAEQLSAVYPRVCGGTGCWHSDRRILEGLSPRVRGNLRALLLRAPSYRSIPACAGEPHAVHARRVRREVYPRVCGGTPKGAACVLPSAGLSPRVRGNRQRRPVDSRRYGSIPACAGEPRTQADKCSYCRVYPRVCGGTSRILPCNLPVRGLSPRVRGNLTCGCSSRYDRGSIPACAGEPSGVRGMMCGTGVYPRVCGGT